jgi:hypothetical protein
MAILNYNWLNIAEIDGCQLSKFQCKHVQKSPPSHWSDVQKHESEQKLITLAILIMCQI